MNNWINMFFAATGIVAYMALIYWLVFSRIDLGDDA